MREGGGVKKKHLRILQELLGLGVVLGFNLIVVEEVFLIASVAMDLEALAIKGVAIDFASYIVDSHVKRVSWSFVGFRLADIGRSWRAAVTRIFVIVQ